MPHTISISKCGMTAIFAIMLALICGLSAVTEAATWNGGGDGSTWEQDANWGGAAYPGSGAGGQDALFNSSLNAIITNSTALIVGDLEVLDNVTGTAIVTNSGTGGFQVGTPALRTDIRIGYQTSAFSPVGSFTLSDDSFSAYLANAQIGRGRANGDTGSGDGTLHTFPTFFDRPQGIY